MRTALTGMNLPRGMLILLPFLYLPFITIANTNNPPPPINSGNINPLKFNPPLIVEPGKDCPAPTIVVPAVCIDCPGFNSLAAYPEPIAPAAPNNGASNPQLKPLDALPDVGAP